MAAMSGAWLCKKVRHPWLGGPRRLTMYLATLDCAISNPSLSSSPWTRGAPQSGFFDAHPPDQHAQLRVDLRSPSQWARLPTPVAAKAGPVPTHERLVIAVGVYSHRLNARARLHVYPFHPRRPGCDSEYPKASDFT